MKIIYNKYLPPKGYVAINICGVIFARSQYEPISERIKRHETTHARQMKEMLYLPFYLWYGLEWLFRLIQYRNRMTAYYNISFEREAYANDKSQDYLNTRKWWAWVRYLKRI